jgi:hypothetical protein
MHGIGSRKHKRFDGGVRSIAARMPLLRDALVSFVCFVVSDGSYQDRRFGSVI